jgi:hypothetical protein
MKISHGFQTKLGLSILKQETLINLSEYIYIILSYYIYIERFRLKQKNKVFW